MFIYQFHPRVIRFDAPGSTVDGWPVEAEVQFHFQPLQPFGVVPGGGRTAVVGAEATLSFNANTGANTVESKAPLQPLKVVIEDPARVFSLSGNVLTVIETFDSWETLSERIESIYLAFPILLNVSFADPPVVERVCGTIGGHGFRWELAQWKMEFDATTQGRQESNVVQAWQRMPLFADRSRSRLLAALHYFHVACRLERSGGTPGEFLPEVLLNLAKTLEAIFPPRGDHGSIDAARSGLRRLGFPDEEIETNFTPAIALRNRIGVGHVIIALFKPDQLRVLHAYTERAESAFRKMLDRLIQKIETGEFEIEAYGLPKPSPAVVQIIERLRAKLK